MSETECDLGAKYVLQGKVISGKTIINEAIIAVSQEKIVYLGAKENFNSTGWGKPHILNEKFTLLPGLVDLHCHGGNGGDFSAGDTNKNLDAIEYSHKAGTTTLVASLMTASNKTLVKAIEALKHLVHKNLLAGIHCEGPFLALSNCGAQNPKWLQNPNLETVKLLVEAAENTLVNMTYAPELPKSQQLVDYLVKSKIIPSIGHTAANAKVTKTFLEKTHTLLSTSDDFKTTQTVTHMFNGMTPLHHRNTGPISSILEFASDKKIVLEIIADGVHVNAEIVALTFKLFGCENIALVTDAISAAGLSNGNYTLGDVKIVVEAGGAYLQDSKKLAGSTVSLLECVKFATDAGVPLVDALFSATATPAKVLQKQNSIGCLKSGAYADILIVNDSLELISTIRNGKKIFGKIFCKETASRPINKLNFES